MPKSNTTSTNLSGHKVHLVLIQITITKKQTTFVICFLVGGLWDCLGFFALNVSSCFACVIYITWQKHSALCSLLAILDFLHARKVSQLNHWFKFAQFPRYPNFTSFNTYGNPLEPENGFSSLPSKQKTLVRLKYGEGGIRTRGRVTPTTTFEVVTLNHSDTSPLSLHNKA